MCYNAYNTKLKVAGIDYMGKRHITAIIAIIITVVLALTACGRNGNTPPINEDTPPEMTETDISRPIADDDTDTEASADDISLEQLIDDYIEKYNHMINGLSISIFTIDDMILEKAYGYADMAAGIPVDPDTVFEWGSVTKLLVYVSAMQLYDQGKLDFHADIFTYIPEDYFPNIIYPTTMFNLMHHTAGFDDLTDRDFYEFHYVPINEDVPTLEDILRDISKTDGAAQNSHPGERVKYSNYGTALAGYVIEQISGVPFYEYVHGNIFATLGMLHTALLPDLSDNEWVKSQRAEIKVYGAADNELDLQRIQIGLYPAGAATGTISDRVRFAKALLPSANGTSALFEKPETLLMLYPSLEDIQNAVTDERLVGLAYHYGFYIITIGGELDRIIGHTGSTDEGFVSALFIDIDRGIGVTFSENTRYGLLNVGEFWSELFEMLFKYR